MTPTDKLELQVAEESDGSATVELLSNEHNPQNNEDTQDSGRLDDDEGSENDDDAGLSADDPEREAIRAARREERRLKKQLHREKARESNHLITSLRKQNQELAGRVASLETKTSGAELARLDKAIDDAGTRVEYAKMKMQEAVNTRDGASVTQAQQAWYDSQRQLETLQSMRENANTQLSQPRHAVNVPEPMVQRNAAEWMKRNDWYDPQLKDVDSKLAQSLDQALTEEGFDPALPEYWDELDERLQKYLPQRANSGYSTGTRNSRPRSVVSSSGRESIGNVKSNQFRLTPQRVAAIKEAGMWNSTELRNKMIRKYADFDRQQKRG